MSERGIDEKNEDLSRYDGKSVVYKLRLEHGAFYIGRSRNVSVRIEKHKTNDSCFWLNRHHFVAVDDIITMHNMHGEIIDADQFFEDSIVLRTMASVGIDLVRGGSWSKLELTNDDIKTIQGFLKNGQDLCYLCQSEQHMWKNCPQVKCKNPDCKNPMGHTWKECKDPSNMCWNCGKVGHFSAQCLERFLKKSFLY